MHFRLRQDTQEWFKKISDKKPIDTMFDLYYFCVMLGLAANRTSVPSKRCPEYSDFIDNFVSAYRPNQRIIIGLLIRAELGRFGISIDEKDEVSRLLLDLVDPNTQTNLTDTGIEKLNEYASGGFDYLSEVQETKPYHAEEFLRSYVRLIREAVRDNPVWKLASKE
jgi:hypothetical protein